MNPRNLRFNSNQPWFEVKNVSESSADLYLYDVIGEDWNGNGGAKDWVAKIKALTGKHINLHINSPGGSVFDASAIVMALGTHNGGVTAHIDGLAASAASWVALAADKVLMSDTGRFMMHNASAMSWGDSRVMRKTADLLDSLNATIAEAYKKRAKGKKDEDIRNAMDAETWLSAAEAQAWGFVDEVVTGIKATNCANAEIAAALGFKNAPQEIFNQPAHPAPAAHSPVKPAAWYRKRQELNKRLVNS